ncbi:MAG TPA: phosphotransferase [Kofleriaceae bacterium]|nr:phosphotransferase [Kofleriaceae bacterium]
MAGLTRLGDSDVRALARGFRLGEVSAWGEVPAGTINSNYWVETGARRWFLRVNEDKSEADVRWEAALVAALAADGVPTPPPIEADDGEPLRLHRDRWISLFPWVAGDHREPGQVAEADAAGVGAALALLHLAGAPLARAMPRTGIYTTAHIAERFARLRADAAASNDPALAGALAAVGDELAWLAVRAEQRAAAPLGIIHGDLFPDNVLFAGGGPQVVALLDFEQASLGAWVYDLAVCINAWCFTDGFAPALVRALVDGYRGQRELEPLEEELLHVEARAAAVRFTVTRITDVHCRGLALAGKDFRRFLRRLEAWRELGADGLAAWLAGGQ